MGGYFESAAFKSLSMQTRRRRGCAADPALRSEGAEGHRCRRREDARAPARGQEAPRGAGHLRREGRRQGRQRDPLQGPGEDRPGQPDRLRRRGQAGGRRTGQDAVHADRLAAAGALPGRRDPERDPPALHRLRQVRRPAAQGQEPARRLLLRRHHLHAEPQFAEEGQAARLHEPARVPRRRARVEDAQLPGDDPGVRQGRLCRPRHPARDDRCAHRRTMPPADTSRARCRSLPARRLRC